VENRFMFPRASGEWKEMVVTVKKV
jgi:hypothetical protein